MQNDSASNDPRTIWQNQPTEPSAMTLETTRQKSRDLHAKTRRTLLRGMVVPVLMPIIPGWLILQINGGLLLQSMFAFSVIWGVAGMYFLNRGMWSTTLPGDAAFTTGLESYRREVQRQRHLSKRFLLWSLGPVLLALATSIGPLVSLGIRHGMLRNMTPMLVLLVIWIVSVVVMRMRDRRKLQQEIDNLNEIERANAK